MTIKYEVNSFVPYFSKSEMDSMQRMLSLDLPDFSFDPAYVSHIARFHGGKPINRHFRTFAGNNLSIDRFLNYSDTELLLDEDLKGLNANVVWSQIDDRLGIYLLPFAILPGGDFLCFDYSEGVAPKIVLWSHELSLEDNPHVEGVARDFTEFSNSLI